MKRMMITTGILFLMLVIFSGVNAQKPWSGMEKGKPCCERMAANSPCTNMQQNLLSDEQKEIFKEIRIKAMKESKPLQDQLRELKAHHQTLVTADEPNMKEIYASIDKMSEVKSALAKIRAKSKVEMASHLTDEQKAQMGQHRGMKDGMGHPRRHFQRN